MPITVPRSNWGFGRYRRQKHEVKDEKKRREGGKEMEAEKERQRRKGKK